MQGHLYRKLNQKGFTVLEFLIASTVFLIVMAAGSDFFGNLNNASVNNEQATDMQQDLRAAMLTLVRDISLAGYGTSSAGLCPNAITPSNSASGPDSISIATFGTIATSLSADANPGASTLSLGSQVLGKISINGVRTLTSTANAGTTVNISPIIAIGETYAAGTPILSSNCIQYSVNTATRQLIRTVDGTASVLADGVKDLQFAYALDADGNGLIDDNSVPLDNLFGEDDFIDNPAAANLDDIRLVRVSLLLQTTRPDPNYINGLPITLEDHDPTSDAGYALADYQPYRSRILTRIVRPRNIGLP